jgi:hypothetical protein
LAFEVKDLDHVMENRDPTVYRDPYSPADGVRVAMVVYNGTPIVLFEYEKIIINILLCFPFLTCICDGQQGLRICEFPEVHHLGIQEVHPKGQCRRVVPEHI